jgi:DNA-binding ferritin-like protein
MANPPEPTQLVPAPLVADTLEFCRAEVSRVVEASVRATEHGVIGAGNALSSIVDCAREQAGSLEVVASKVGGGGDSGIGGAIRAQASAMGDFTESLVARAHRQRETTRKAAGMSQDIQSLARQLQQIAIQARVLSLNAKIECAHLGVHGAALSAVASEMEAVTNAVKRANDDIARLAASLTKSLPELSANAEELAESSQSFATSFSSQSQATEDAFSSLMDAVRESTSVSHKGIEQILRLSRDALSSLQFQDPVAQNLRELDEVFFRAADDCGAPLDDEPDWRLGTQIDRTDNKQALYDVSAAPVHKPRRNAAAEAGEHAKTDEAGGGDVILF